MPVRIYDIAKEHGIKPKDVIDLLLEHKLAKSGLKPSSTIDKVTAEYLKTLLPPAKTTNESQQGEAIAGSAAAESGTPQESSSGVQTPVVSTGVGTAPTGQVTTLEATTEAVEAVQVVSTPEQTPSVIESEPRIEIGKEPVLTGDKSVESTVVPPATEQQLAAQQAEAAHIQTQASAVAEPPSETQVIETQKQPEETIVAQQPLPVTTGESAAVAEPPQQEKVATEAQTSVQTQAVEDQKIIIADTAPAGQIAEHTKQEEAVTEQSQASAQETTASQENAQQTEQVAQQPPQPKQPGIGEVVGRIDISKYLSGRDKFKEKEREKDKKKQKEQEQKKGAQPAGKQQPQKPAQPVKGQQPAKPAQQKPQQQQQSKKQPVGPVVIVKPPVGKDGKAPKSEKVPKLPPDAPVVSIKPPITVRELAEKLGKKPFQVIAELLKRKIMANVNALVDEVVAKDIAAVFGINLVIEKRGAKPPQPKPEPTKQKAVDEDPAKLKPRPPVVTIMGHVDHGKTTLLDAIRKSNVAATEAGGITQHIGAYTITIPHPDDKKRMMYITFLDTPGHAAFSAMRARGANVTDIVVLVVAADDGVMPQTIEALNHAKAANVPIIVAVNKCDHPNANPMRVREQLSKHGLTPEEWGGDTLYVDVSALKKLNIDKLLEMIVLKAEVMELKANPDCPASGYVIESALEAGGPAVTLLVKRGTLRVGDIVLCGQYYGKARALINEKNERQKEAGPSFAVKMLGLNGVPEPGSAFEVVDDLDVARERAEKKAEELRNAGQAATTKKLTLESLLQAIESNQVKVLKVVIKGDTQGSVEAICSALKDIKSDKVSLEIIHSGVGPVSESDVMLASAAKGIIIGFHTRLEHGVSDIAKREGVQIKLYTIIYELIDEVKKAMAGLLEPIIKEVVIGRADVKKVFELSKGGKVAGCMVREGIINRGKVRVYRGKDLIYQGVIMSLRHFQDEVNEIRAGMECGIRIEGFNDFQEGDVIECYNIEKTLQELN